VKIGRLLRGVQLIRINVQDDSIIIRPFEKSAIPHVARLFNSGSEMRYATGIDNDISLLELESIFDTVSAQDENFLAGIYIKGIADSTGNTAEEQFAGICSGMICGRSIWFRHLSIMPAYRRKGIGRKAAEMIFRYSKNLYGTHDVYISVLDENSAGLSFWKKLGFVEVTSIKKVLFAERLFCNVIIMRKELQ